MEMLCKKIGARPTGSAKNRAALEYASGVFQKSGFLTSKQEFDCIDWINSGAALRIDCKNIPVVPAEYSLACDIEAEFVCIESAAALRGAELSGKIAVLYGGLCQEPLMPKNFEFWNPDEHRQIIALLEEKNPRAIITVSPQEDSPVHIIQDGDFNIPCAAACGNVLETFLQCAGRKAGLTINTQRIPAKAHNVIATYGTGRDKLCFSAHIDTKPATPGALDNASGVSVLLALAESLADVKTGKEFPFQIEFVLLNGEDYYSVPGEMVYMRQLNPAYILAINVDGIGLKESKTSVSFYECSEELENRIIESVKTTTGIEIIEPWPMGDHMVFVNEGIPAIAITACNIFSLIDSVIHTNDDDMKNIDMDILNNITCFLLNCIEQRVFA